MHLQDLTTYLGYQATERYMLGLKLLHLFRLSFGGRLIDSAVVSLAVAPLCCSCRLNSQRCI